MTQKMSDADAFQVFRGEIYFACLDPVIGHETGKTRPVLIIQNDIGNCYSPTTIVSILSGYSEKKASFPICVPAFKDQGIPKDSIINLSQIRTIDKKRLISSPIATLSAETMQQVDAALKISLSLK